MGQSLFFCFRLLFDLWAILHLAGGAAQLNQTKRLEMRGGSGYLLRLAGGAGRCSQRTPNPDLRQTQDPWTPQSNTEGAGCRKNIPSDSAGSPCLRPSACNAPRSSHLRKSCGHLVHSAGVLHSNSCRRCMNAARYRILCSLSGQVFPFIESDWNGSCFALLYWFLLCSKVPTSYTYIHPLDFLPHGDYRRALSKIPVIRLSIGSINCLFYSPCCARLTQSV